MAWHWIFEGVARRKKQSLQDYKTLIMGCVPIVVFRHQGIQIRPSSDAIEEPVTFVVGPGVAIVDKGRIKLGCFGGHSRILEGFVVGSCRNGHFGITTLILVRLYCFLLFACLWGEGLVSLQLITFKPFLTPFP